MSTVQFPTSDVSNPDFNSIAQAVKAIKRSDPATSDGVYTYFVDKFKLAREVADELDKQITLALTSLPPLLEQMNGIPTILEQIGKVDKAEREGKTSTDKAAIARAQLQARMGTTVSSTVTGFREAATRLSEPAKRLTNYAREIEVRQKDAVATETSNLARVQQDVERESARLNVLEAHYEKLKSAVDKARGGPTEDLVELLPGKEELASLGNVGAEAAAGPKVAVAKAVVEAGLERVKKIVKFVDKTIQFEQLTELCNEVYKMYEAQRKVTEAAQERLQKQIATLADLDTFKTMGALMTPLAAETNKLVTAFSSFATSLDNLEGQTVTANTLEGVSSKMKSYLEQARNARNSVILA